MHLGLGNQLGAKRPAYSPVDLFANSEPGFTFPDLNPARGMLFQNSAGTTPATAAGEPVALVLDESGNGNDAIQDVNTDYRPILRQEVTGEWYLDFDGVDDYLYIPSLDMSSTDAVSVFAGVHKASDVDGGTIAEFSVEFGVNNGAFQLRAPHGTGPNYRWNTKGTISAKATATPFAAPTTNVVTCLADISEDTCLIRVDGLEKNSVSDAQGTGNYGSYPLYIGSRAGTSFFFEGELYSLTVLGRTATSAEIGASEAFAASKTAGVSL